MSYWLARRRPRKGKRMMRLANSGNYDDEWSNTDISGRYHHAGGRRDRQRGQLRARPGRRGLRRDLRGRRSRARRGVCRGSVGARRAMPSPRPASGCRPASSSTRSGRSGAAVTTTRPRCSRPAYRRATEVARAAGARSLAFPAISTGIYGYPPDAAAEIAVRTLKACAGDLEVTLVAFDAATLARYDALLG